MATEPETAAAEEHPNGKEPAPFGDIARKVLLAAIGAVALTQDEIEKFVDRLVERGEIAEKDGKRLIRELVEKRKKRTEEGEDQFGKRVEGILDRMNVPTKADIQALGEKIAALAQKVEELKKTQP